MRSNSNILFLIVFGLCPFDGHTQSLSNNYSIYSSDESSLLSESQVLLEELEFMKVDLNQATSLQLGQLPFLDQLHIKRILEYRKESGKFKSINELQVLQGFDAELIESLKPYLIVKDLPTQLYSNRRGYLILNSETTLQPKSGYSSSRGETKFLGSTFHNSFRYRDQLNRRTEVGLNFDKDAGERFLKSSYLSGYLKLSGAGKLKNLLIGDFKTAWGQGLVFGGGFNIGKSPLYLNTIKKVSQGFIPNRSLSEVGFFRGVAATFNLRIFNMSLFGSHNRLNARLTDDGKIQSISESTLFRTKTDIMRFRTASESNIGLNISLEPAIIPGLHAGLNMLLTKFNKEFEGNSELGFRHQSVPSSAIASGYVDFRKDNYSIFGEFAMNPSGANGWLFGWMTSLSASLESIAIIRNYSSEFQSRYGLSAFREGSKAVNERGLYWGLRYHIRKHFIISGYADIFKFPWVRYRVNGPSKGQEYQLSLDKELSETAHLRIQFRSEIKEINFQDDQAILRLESRVKDQIRLSTRFQITNNIEYQAGLWLSKYRHGSINESGELVYSKLSINRSKWRIQAMVSLTDAPHFETRFYLYESDLLYTFSVPPSSGKNIRYYLLLRYLITSQIQGRIKWAQTRYYDRQSIGTGADTIDGPVRSDLKLQLVYRFRR